MKKVFIQGTRYASFIKVIKDSKVGAEIGVAQGHFSKHLCSTIPGLKLYSIDPYRVFSGCTHGETQDTMNRLYIRACNRLVHYNCVLIREYSLEAVKMFKDGSLDFVYIDAAHDYESVYSDIKAWSKKVKTGGIVSGHDYTDPIEPRSLGYYKEVYDVKAAVNDWCKENKIKTLYLFIKNDDRSWYYVKS